MFVCFNAISSQTNGQIRKIRLDLDPVGPGVVIGPKQKPKLKRKS